VFNTTDAHEWLAQENYGIEDRALGVFSECGSFYEDNQHYYACSMHTHPEQLGLVVNNKNKPIVMFDTYASIIKEGMTVNQMIERKLITKRQVSCKYPLKFSFDPNTIYEDVEAAKTCPHQGFFYG
jgi:phage-related protein